MKQRIYTLVIMLALVVMAGSAWAQSTPRYPFAGETETYSVDGLTVGDSVFFFVTDNTVTFPSDIAGDSITNGTEFTWASAITGVNANNEATAATVSVDIKWDNPSGDYHVWIGIKDASSGCYNYRYAPVIFRWDVQIFAVAVTDTTTMSGVTLATDTIAVNNADSTAYCAVIEPNSVNYNDTLSNGDLNALGVTNNGSTWIYYRIVRRNSEDATNNWSFNLSLDADPVANSIQYSENGTTWSDRAEGNITVATDNLNVVYVRAEYLASTTEINVAARVDGSSTDPSEATSGDTDAVDATDDVYVTINPIPTVGGFAGFE